MLGCQRDDICAESTPTTPQLILRFYENTDPFPLSAPRNLNIRAVGVDSILYAGINRDSIAIPLKTDTGTTSYIFTINALDDDEEEDPEFPAVTDTLTFSYGTEQEYINRACAYKVIYTGLNVNLDNSQDQNWIQNIEIEQNTVEDENQAHVSIFF